MLYNMSTPSWLLSYTKPSLAVVKKSTAVYPDPPSFNKDIILNTKAKHGKEIVGPTSEERDTLKVKKAWEIALAPSKSLPMNAIMSYFSGSSLQIFSLTMTFMLFSNPAKAIANVGPTFARYESESTFSRILQAKLVFIVLQLATVAVGLWKMGSMGVLPTKRSDWLAWESETPVLERGVFVS
ncbi:hypothetical protein POJ06DRAFT_255006 [Lipomyces tetrasporus]|uniref:ER membrane protein complex subunit 4 n=1 Tax=Lipomyces tetrasporus TaxID=54092 RepID=A0AAD7QRH5_9ASCO|nr:uncharacterized protein POJ06DRAFT_255006 [Lipomyces tetrasporus]KAJ8099960.1 hypothetical protein POJ06DRAFT_255006 [Lipomyces tetrasporus]